MSGSELQKAILELGLTVAAFSRLSGVSTTTLKKVFRGEYVRPVTVHKAVNEVLRLRAQSYPANASPEKVKLAQV